MASSQARTLPTELWRLILQQDPSNLAAISQVDRNAHQGSLIYSDAIRTQMETLHADKTYIGIFTNNINPEIRAAAATEILRYSHGRFYSAQQHSLFVLGLQLSRIDFIKPFMTEQPSHRVLLEAGRFYRAIQADANLAARLNEVDWLAWPFYELVMPDRGSFQALFNLTQDSTADQIVVAVHDLSEHIGSIDLDRLGQANDKANLIELIQLVLLLALTEALLPIIRTYGLVPAEELDQSVLQQVAFQADRDLMLRLLSLNYLRPAYYGLNLVKHGLELKASYPNFYVTGPTDLLLGSLPLNPTRPNSVTELLNYGQAMAVNPAQPGQVTIYSDWRIPLCQELLDRHFALAVVGDIDEIYGDIDQDNHNDPGNPNWPSFDVDGSIAVALLQNGTIDIVAYFLALFNLVRGNYLAGRHYGPDPIPLLRSYYVNYQLVNVMTQRMQQYRANFPLVTFINSVVFLWRDPGVIPEGEASLEQLWADLPTNFSANYVNWWLAARANNYPAMMDSIVQRARAQPHNLEKIDLLGLAFWARKVWPVMFLTQIPVEILPLKSLQDFVAWYSLIEFRLER